MKIHISTIDVENLTVQSEQVSQVFVKYIENYIERMDIYDKRKVYEVGEEYPTLLTCIKEIIVGNDFVEGAMAIANHLLDSERVAKSQIYDFETSNKKGSLIQVMSDSFYLIFKSEQEAYLAGNCLETQYGVSLDNMSMWKSIYIPYYVVADQVHFDNVLVHSLAKQRYWVQSFLCLQERLDDAKNTEVAYRALDQELKSLVAPYSKKDYVQLSSQVQDRMQESTPMDFNDFVEDIVKEYKPSVEEINKDVMLDTLLSLPARKKFETEFNVKPESVINKRTKKFICAPGIELVVHSDASAYANKIISTLSDGKKVLQVVCEDEDTYDSFA